MASSAPPLQTQTLSADLMACLGQEDMTDMHLLGTDGVKVPAFRTILACRSDVFRKMLVGNFKESTSDTIELGYSSEALRAVVEFCITDNITQFDGRSDESAARGIVQLVACAHFLNMHLVEEKARTMAKTLVKEHKSCACAIFDEATLVGKPAESVKLDALNTMRNIDGVSLCLSANVISCLKPEALGELISDDGMHCEEIDMFRALNEWATAEVEDSSLKLVPEEGRVDIAKQLAAAFIRLPSIKPSDLVGIVRESGLVDERMISEALEAQALFAESETDLTFSKKRKEPTGFDVSGAGTDVVNGFYKKDGDYLGFPKFTKTCKWEGEKRTLCIFRYKGSQWYIAIVEKDGSIGSSGCDFYNGVNQKRKFRLRGGRSQHLDLIHVRFAASLDLVYIESALLTSKDSTLLQVGQSRGRQSGHRYKTLAASLIRMSSMRPIDLVDVVRRSCLVDKTTISAALEACALLDEKCFLIKIAKFQFPRDAVQVLNAYYDYAFYDEDEFLEGYWAVVYERVFFLLAHGAIVGKGGHIMKSLYQAMVGNPIQEHVPEILIYPQGSSSNCHGWVEEMF